MKTAQLNVQERRAVERLKELLRERLGETFVEVRLYGSRARGEAHEESDIDLLILLRETSSAIKDVIYEIGWQVLEECNEHLELYSLTVEEYQRHLDLQTPFLLNVDRESVVL